MIASPHSLNWKSNALWLQAVARPSDFDVEGGVKPPPIEAQLPAFSGVEGLQEVREAH